MAASSRLQELNDKTGSKFEDCSRCDSGLFPHKRQGKCGVIEEEGKDTKTRLHVWKDKAS